MKARDELAVDAADEPLHRGHLAATDHSISPRLAIWEKKHLDLKIRQTLCQEEVAQDSQITLRGDVAQEDPRSLVPALALCHGAKPEAKTFRQSLKGAETSNP